MDEKRKPFENEVPKHKKKSKKKGQPRADHKHEYKEVVVHSWWDNPFKQGVKNESTEICKVCTVCGRIGDYITSRLFGLEYSDYDTAFMEHWMIDDYFDKFAKKDGGKLKMNGRIGKFDGQLVYNVVPYPLEGMIYFVETSAESDEAWIANKPIQYIDEEGYHCGWGLATLCFKFEDLNEVYFFSREEAKVNLGYKEKQL